MADDNDDILAALAAVSRSFSSELTSRVGRLDGIIGNRHWLSVGNYKESLVRDLLRRHLPSRLTVSTGFVLAQLGGKRVLSRQIDVLVWNSHDHGPYLVDGEFVIVPPDALVAAIEVKGNLTRAALWDAIHALDSLSPFRDIPRFVGPETKFFKAIFAYQRDAKLTFPEGMLDILSSYYHSDTTWKFADRLKWLQQLDTLPNGTFPFVDVVATLGTGVIALREWFVNKETMPAYTAWATVDANGDDTYGFLQREFLANILSKGKPRWLSMHAPGAATLLDANGADLLPGKCAVLLRDAAGEITSIGTMKPDDVKDFVGRIHGAKACKRPKKLGTTASPDGGDSDDEEP